jgi:hypothetical protein
MVLDLSADDLLGLISFGGSSEDVLGGMTRLGGQGSNIRARIDTLTPVTGGRTALYDALEVRCCLFCPLHVFCGAGGVLWNWISADPSAVGPCSWRAARDKTAAGRLDHPAA